MQLQLGGRMQVARYWRNKGLLYQLRRNRYKSERVAVVSRPPAERKTRRKGDAKKVVVA